ncbi:unnamed protein product [Moneuplotes crassus]|uniref:Major facilitator superfamily (MFS) profile domain-containing protein n=1 Tax=Euplotes crassus TaxID=5936 RepID=A0AAD1UDS9_EUPCR|nr:unnamed protein product [Moneuplotes crassus]
MASLESCTNNMVIMVRCLVFTHIDKQRIPSEDLFNSVVSGMFALGAIPGSILATPIMKKGRRLTLIMASLITVLGSTLVIIFNIWSLFFGRFEMGVAVGNYYSVCPLYISEMSFPSISGSLGSLNQMSLSTGLRISFGLAYILPYSHEPETLTTGLWKVVVTCILIIFDFFKICVVHTQILFETFHTIKKPHSI